MTVTGMLQISNLIMGIVLNCREVLKCFEVLGQQLHGTVCCSRASSSWFACAFQLHDGLG